MFSKKFLSKFLSAVSALILSGVLLGSVLVTPSWAMLSEDESYLYDSLDDLKSKARTTITFIHHLSSFTTNRMSESTRAFFTDHGNFIDQDGNVPENVKIVDNFAIDTQSHVAPSQNGMLLLGQNTTTKQFFALKRCHLGGDTNEIEMLTLSKRYHGTIDLTTLDSSTHEPKTTKYFIMDLVDGVTFNDFRWMMLPKINKHAQYLISFNLIKEIDYISSLNLRQPDQNLKNFMVDARDLSVKMVDFDHVEEKSSALNDYRNDWEVHSLLWFVFNSALKGHAKGSFQDMLNIVSETDTIDSAACIQSLPFK